MSGGGGVNQHPLPSKRDALAGTTQTAYLEPKMDND